MAALNNYISNSVGDPKKVKSSDNRDSEVKTVQGLLNVQIIKDNRSDQLLKITSKVDDDTLKAIIEFQRRRGFPQTGLIAPRDNAYSALFRFSGSRGMSTSYSGKDFIQREEGFKEDLYDNDGAGNTTIGWGHLVHRGPINGTEPEEFKHRITRDQAERLFHDDLEKDAGKPVNDLVEVPLAQNQFDALVSLVFNIGEGNFKSSTLLKMLNTGDYGGAADQFPRWDKVHVHGHLKSSSDLDRRRSAERERFLRR